MSYTEAVQLATGGDESGYNILYELTYQSKYYLALKYMQNEEAAKDVLQDAYIKAFSSLDTLENPEKFSSWLGMIVANTAKNALKKKNPILFTDIATDSEEEYEYQIEDDNIQNQPEIAYSQKEVQELVRELIDSLPEEQRMCILMFHIEEQSIREIAEALGCSENTVKSRLTYGRKNIKQKAEALEKKGYKLFSVAFLISLLQSEEKALAAQGAFYEAGNTMADHIMDSVSLTDISQAAGQKAASEVLKQGFLHTAAGKIAAVVIGVCIIVTGMVCVVVFNINASLNTGIDTMANMETPEQAMGIAETGTPAQAEEADAAETPVPAEEADAAETPVPAEETSETEMPVPTEEVSVTETPDQAEPEEAAVDDDSAPELFGEMPEHFIHSSGAGAWGTELHLEADGSFHGKYSDSDLGSTGKKYPNGTMYICKFKGKFSTPKKINKYTYSTRIESLEQERTPDEVYYKKGKRYIVCKPYGLADAEEILIYLPNAPVSKLSEDFLFWVFLDYLPRGKKLEHYGIYNVATKEGFSGYKK